MEARRLALVLVLLGASVASVTPTRGAAQEGHEGATVDVVVQNHASTGTHVYALQAGHMVPLGFVDAAQTETMRVPSVLVAADAAIRLVADPLASSDWYESDAITVRPGQEVSLRIEDVVARSSVVVEDGA